MLHDTVAAVEGESGVESREQVLKASLSWGEGGASPSIATSSRKGEEEGGAGPGGAGVGVTPQLGLAT